MQYRRVFFDFQTGDGFEEVTNLVKFDDLTYTVRAGSDNFHYAQNTANISLIYDATIYGKVRDNTADIIVRIIDTDETADIPAVYTPLFWGHIAPTKSHTYNGIINNTILKLEVVDDGDYLKKEVGDICYRGFRIMDSANPDYSIVHQLAYKAGFTVAQIDSAVSISTVLNAFVPPSTSDDIRDLLDALLFEYGYTLAFNAEGEISPIKWMYTTADLSFTFNEDNIIDELDVNDRLKEYDGAEVTYYELGEGTTTSGQTDILLYRDGDLPYADDGSFLGYAVLSGYTYPPLTNILDETTGEATVVYQEYEDTAIKYWTNKAITDKLDYNYKAFTSDFSSIVATSGHYLDYKADAGVSLVTSEFENTQARIVFSGMNNTANLLYYCNVYGKVLYKTAERISTVVTISGSEDLDEYVSTFIFEKDDADTLVKFLALQHSTNNLEIEVISSADVAVGAIVQVVANDGTNELCRIATKKYNEKTLQFTYTLYSYMYGSEATLPDLTSQSASSPSRIGGVTASVAVADLRAALGGELYVSTTGITRSRNGALLPDEVIADAKYKYDGTTYSGRFSVEVSGDGLTYHEHYKSITDEASHTFDVPVRSNVPDCQAYYPATGLSEYPDDPAGTTYIQDAWATVDGWDGTSDSVLTVSGGRLISTVLDTKSAWRVNKAFAAGSGKTYRAKILTNKSGTIGILAVVDGAPLVAQVEIPITGNVEKIIDYYIAGNVTQIQFRKAGMVAGDWGSIDFIYIGTGKYLDGSLQNQISDSYDATIYGCTPDGAGGLIGDGVNDYILGPVVSDLVSFSCVFRTGSTLTAIKRIASNWNTDYKGVTLYVSNIGALRILAGIGVSSSSLEIQSLAINTEYKVTFVILGTSLKVYVNGTLKLDVTLASAFIQGTLPLYFLRASNAATEYTAFTISGVRWYNRALTALEVLQLYNDPTDPAYYTVDVRTRLFAAGGVATRLGESLCTVALESNASAIYWGALTSAPSSGFIAGDYYFDSNTVALGGGKIRSYTGTAWVEVAPGASGYADMWSVAGPDAWIWAQQQGQILAEATKLSTATAKAISDKQIVSSLPASPYTGYFVGDIVVLTTDNKLYRLTSSGWTKAVDGADATNIPITAFASGIRPTRVVASLPTSPFTGYVAGDTVVLTTDNKLYRFTGTAFTKAVDAVDIVANSITAGQIATGAIAADELASNAVTAVKIAAGVITADKMTVITKNKVNNLFGGVLADWSAGSIDTTTHTDKGPMLLLSTNNNLQSYSSWFEVDPTKSYEVEIWVRADVAKNSYYFGMNSALDSVGTEDSVIPTGYNYTTKTWGSFGAAQKNPYFTYNKDSRPTVWLKIRSYILGCNAVVADIPAPEGSSSYVVYAFKLLPTAKYARLRILNYNATTFGDGTLTNLWMYSPRVTEIGTGSIIAENIAAGSITASKIAVSDLAANSTFTNALNTNTAYIASLAGQSAFFTALSAQTAFLEQLASKVAFIEALFANQVTVPAGGRIRYETGAGVQKRCVQLADEKIDWLDTPDTTPASAEKLIASIYRMEAGGPIVLGGPMFVEIAPSWGTYGETTLNVSITVTTPSSILDYKLNARTSYAYDPAGGSSRNIYERVINADGTLIAEALIVPYTEHPAKPYYISRRNGELYLLYMSYSDVYIRKFDYSSDTWGGGTKIATAKLLSERVAVGVEDKNEVVHILITDSITGVPTSYTLNTSDYTMTKNYEIGVVRGMRFAVDTDIAGNIFFLYGEYDSYKMNLLSINQSSYTLLTSFSPASGAYFDISISRKNIIYVTYRSSSQNISAIEYSTNGTIVKDDYVAFSKYYIGESTVSRDVGGNLRFSYVGFDSGDVNKLRTSIILFYARVGAGIIESGGNDTTGYWELSGNGKLEQWGTKTSSAGFETLTFPKPYANVNYNIQCSAVHVTDSALRIATPSTEGGAPTVSTHRIITTIGGTSTSGVKFYWRVIGMSA